MRFSRACTAKTAPCKGWCGEHRASRSRCVSIRTRQNGKKSAFSLLSVLKYVSIPTTFRLEKSRFFIRFRSKIYCLGFLCQCKAKTQLMLCAFASILTQQWRENPGNKRVRILTHLLKPLSLSRKLVFGLKRVDFIGTLTSDY